MKILRGFGVALLGLVAVVFAISVAARLSDGPFGPFPGGPLGVGEMVRGPEPDWSFARDIEEIELQLLEPPRSRTVWIVTHEGKAYVPCGFLYVPFFKQWPYQAAQDGRALLRIEGKRYERTLVKVDEPGLRATLGRLVGEKYMGDSGSGEPPPADEVWFFRLDPRGA